MFHVLSSFDSLSGLHSLIIWIDCDPKVHDARLKQRVDKMMDRGLLREVCELHSVLKGSANGK